jgi:membrane fusion protein, multidrug efflux system
MTVEGVSPSNVSGRGPEDRATPAETAVPPVPVPVPVATGRPRPRRSPRLFVSGVLLVVTAGAVVGWWVWSLVHVRTNNAYVEGNITPVSSEISGKVVALFADDNMIVKAGAPIAQIDPVPFQLEVDQELADLRRLEAEARAAEVNFRLVGRDRKARLDGAIARRGEADRRKRAAGVEVETRRRIHEKERELLASQQARLPGLVALAKNARDYYDRFSRLASSGDVPVQDRDNREATYREAVSNYESLRSDVAAGQRQVLASELQLQEAGLRLEQSEQALNGANSEVVQAEAAQLQPDIAAADLQAIQSRVRQAESRLQTARLNLSYCLIRAPQGGIVSRRTIQLGEILAARQAFLRIVPLDLDDVWVIANLREDQMKRVRVGNPVTVSLDGIPERTFHGWVESVAGGTGSVFSLFPPDNATGNFVRVVQRLPVRIRFSEPENFENRIRPGMSSVVLIDDSRVVRRSTRAW